MEISFFSTHVSTCCLVWACTNTITFDCYHQLGRNFRFIKYVIYFMALIHFFACFLFLTSLFGLEFKVLYNEKGVDPSNSWVYHEGLVTTVKNNGQELELSIHLYIMSVYWFVTTVSE